MDIAQLNDRTGEWMELLKRAQMAIQKSSASATAKAQGEAAVLEHRPDAVILRPSVIFGAEDQLFNQFAGLSRLGPVTAIAGGNCISLFHGLSRKSESGASRMADSSAPTSRAMAW